MLIHLKSMMQYKTSFLLVMFGQFLVSFNVFLGIYFMFQRFPKVRGFDYEEVLLCFAINIMAYSLAELVARGFDCFPSMLRNSEFDRVLVRPKGIILQVLASKMELTRIGRMIQAVIMFTYGVTHSDIQWSFAKILTVFFMLVGGVILFSALFVMYAAVSFFTLEGIEFMNIVTDGAREYGKYPLGIYGKDVLRFCTYLVPYALFQYYPLLYLLDRNTSPFLIVLPLLTVIFFFPALGLFHFGVRKYKSNGS
jgi:ABC-2 type transport system permease protein